MIAYQDVRIGSTEHYTTDLEGSSAVQLVKYEARTLCGIAVAGTPVAPASAGSEPCQACQALLPCDECDHPGTEHLWAPALEATGQAEAARYVYDHATCWAENICKSCDPELHNDVLVRGLGQAVPS